VNFIILSRVWGSVIRIADSGLDEAVLLDDSFTITLTTTTITLTQLLPDDATWLVHLISELSAPKLTGLSFSGSHADWLGPLVLPRWLPRASLVPTLADCLGPLWFPRWLTGLGLLRSHADWLWLELLGLPRWLTALGLLGSHADWFWLGILGLPRWLTGLGLLGSHADWLWLGLLGLPRWLWLSQSTLLKWIFAYWRENTLSKGSLCLRRSVG
jgi:hypothetical protein